MYTNPQEADETGNCDRVWAELWDRIMVGIDWSGLEDEKSTGWHRKIHIHTDPFYYVEYGIAQLGAFQVWRNSLEDHHQAVRCYRNALSKGNTLPLDLLFKSAGITLAFDRQTCKDAINLAESTLSELYEIEQQ